MSKFRTISFFLMRSLELEGKVRVVVGLGGVAVGFFSSTGKLLERDRPCRRSDL